VRAFLAALLLSVAAGAAAEVLTFDRIEWDGSWGPGFPDDARARWESISLPHNWYTSPPATGTLAWYRARFTLEQAPAEGQSLYFPKLELRDLAVYVNGLRVWKLGERIGAGVATTTVVVPIPPGVLRGGENSIHLEARGYPRWHHGVSRFQVGNSLALAERASRASLLQSQLIYVSALGFGIVGLICLWLWWRSGREPVLFWYGVSGVMLLGATALWYETLWRPEHADWRLMLTFLRFHGFMVPILVLHLRLADRRHPWLEGGLWLLLAAALVSIGTPSGWQSTAWMAWGLTFATLIAAATIPLLLSPQLRSKPAVLLLVVADLAAALMTYHDWAARLGRIDFDRPYYLLYVAPFVMLAAAPPILARLMVGVDAVRRLNVELERRVAEKMSEIEASQDELRQAQREQALAEERRRIMADMHDGLGARLVALLSVAQSGKARHGEISEGIAAALDELRLTVDSVQPVEGDVSVVLGNVRHRMRSVFERAGVRLEWNVSELPRMDDLTPERILAIQRIFLEAFSNAIRHSQAKTVSVFALRMPGAVRIVIEDDGRGFDPAASRGGTGLSNLRMRSQQAGGTLTVESRAGEGTRVTLTLPLADEAEPKLPRTGEKEEFSPVPGIPPERAAA